VRLDTSRPIQQWGIQIMGRWDTFINSGGVCSRGSILNGFFLETTLLNVELIIIKTLQS